MTLGLNSRIGRIVRREPWADLATSTYERIRQAINDLNYRGAADYLKYFHEEALVCRQLYDQWIPGTLEYLRTKGVTETEIDSAYRRVNAIVSPSPNESWNRAVGWTEYLERKDALLEELSAATSPNIGTSLCDQMRAVKEAWRISHDLDVDALLGLFDFVMDKLGEPAIGEMWEKYLVRDWFDERYAQFDVSKNSWPESFDLLIYLSFEAMHGHLCGPRREGDVEFREFEDRIELQFDPCGSGGRAYRGEPLDGTGSRMNAPYGFRPIQGAYDFTWNKTGICTYCAHCCILTEKLPARTFGYPVRIIDPPSYPHEIGAKCRYTIYRNPRDIPEDVYKRVGIAKPPQDRPLGSANGPFPKSDADK